MGSPRDSDTQSFSAHLHACTEDCAVDDHVGLGLLTCDVNSTGPNVPPPSPQTHHPWDPATLHFPIHFKTDDSHLWNAQHPWVDVSSQPPTPWLKVPSQPSTEPNSEFVSPVALTHSRGTSLSPIPDMSPSNGPNHSAMTQPQIPQLDTFYYPPAGHPFGLAHSTSSPDSPLFPTVSLPPAAFRSSMQNDAYRGNFEFRKVEDENEMPLQQAQPQPNKQTKKGKGHGSYVCPECGSCMARKNNLEQHLRTHDKHRVKLYKCRQCSWSFDRNTDLERHTNTVHLGLRPWGCSHCGKRFKRRDCRDRHESIGCGQRSQVDHLQFRRATFNEVPSSRRALQRGAIEGSSMG